MDNEPLPYVRPHAAWTWECENCGMENFSHAVKSYPDREDEEEMAYVREFLGLNSEDKVPEDTYFLTHEDEVECSVCGKRFTTVSYEGVDQGEENV